MSSKTTKKYTRAQRKFYEQLTPGRKAHMTKVRDEFGNDRTGFSNWFRNYKRQVIG